MSGEKNINPLFLSSDFISQNKIKNLLVMNGWIEEIEENTFTAILQEVNTNLPVEIMQIKKSAVKKEELKLIYEGMYLTLSIYEEEEENGQIKVKTKIKFHRD